MLHLVRHDEDLARALLQQEDESIQDMQATLTGLGLDTEMASKCAGALTETFASYRTGSALPAAAGLQYCREMAVVVQALVIAGADLTCSDRHTWHSLDLRQNQFDSVLVESLDSCAQARWNVLKTRTPPS